MIDQLPIFPDRDIQQKAGAARTIEWPCAGMEEWSFKETADGWVFQPQVLFAPNKSYLVDDQLKAKLAADIRLMWRINTVSIVLGAFIATGLFYNERPLGEWLAVAALGLLVGLSACAYAAFMIRWRVAGLVPSGEQITPSDLIKTEARISSTQGLAICALLNVVGFATCVYEFATSARFEVWSLVGAAIFLGLAVVCTAIFVLKRRMEHAGPPRA
jgi:hypothetical protein